MRVTITVEGDEGIRASSSFTIEELFLEDGKRETLELALTEKIARDEDYAARFNMISEKFVHLAETHAIVAATKIVNWFRNRGGVLMQRNKSLGNDQYVRECKPVEDVDEAVRWVKEGQDDV